MQGGQKRVQFQACRKAGIVKMKKNAGFLCKLFASTFMLSAFTFGGGYVIIPLMKKKFADELHWIDDEEMLNMAAIAQSSPGAVAVNASILVGYRVAGVAGAAISILGTVLPPLIIISVISLFYTAFRTNAIVAAVLKGMQSGVAAVVADVVCNLGGKIVKDKDILSILVMILAFVANYILGVNVILIILACGVVGALRTLLIHGKKEGAK